MKMKCNCGYYRLEKYQIEMEDNALQENIFRNNGDEKFINIKGSFYIERDYGRNVETSIYACPKCGALQIG
jgi:hypothetical protein